MDSFSWSWESSWIARISLSKMRDMVRLLKKSECNVVISSELSFCERREIFDKYFRKIIWRFLIICDRGRQILSKWHMFYHYPKISYKIVRYFWQKKKYVIQSIYLLHYTVSFTYQKNKYTYSLCTFAYTNRSHHTGGTKQQIHELVILTKTDQNAVDHRW